MSDDRRSSRPSPVPDEIQTGTAESLSSVDLLLGGPAYDCVDAATAARVYDSWLVGRTTWRRIVGWPRR